MDGGTDIPQSRSHRSAFRLRQSVLQQLSCGRIVLLAPILTMHMPAVIRQILRELLWGLCKAAARALTKRERERQRETGASSQTPKEGMDRSERLLCAACDDHYLPNISSFGLSEGNIASGVSGSYRCLFCLQSNAQLPLTCVARAQTEVVELPSEACAGQLL